MKSFSVGELEVEIQARLTEVTMNWRGASAARDPAALLGPPLDEVAAEITPEHIVLLDFRALDYMNSSSVRPVLAFLQTAATIAREVRVIYAPEKNWQRLSFMAMRAVLATTRNVVFEP